MARTVLLEMPFEVFTGKLELEKQKANATQKARYFISNYRTASGHAFYSVRKNWRKTGFSTAEQTSQNRFKQASAAVNAALADPTQTAQYKAAFRKQTKYSTLRGYIFAQEYQKLVS